jgi:hypothetical protein
MAVRSNIITVNHKDYDGLCRDPLECVLSPLDL